MTHASDRIRLMRQGRPDFSVGPKLQTIWGFREASVFSLEGLAATVMAVCATASWLPGMIGAELAMIGAVVLLFSHLGNPRAAWRAIANIRRSWISRGTAVIGAFTGLGALLLIFALLIPVPPELVRAVYGLVVACGAFILFYPGFAMAASAGIPFWNTGMLPILSGLGGLSTGGAAALAMAPMGLSLPVSSDAALAAELGLLIAIGIGIIALISASHRMGAGARLSGQLMVRREKMWFWGLAVAVGLAVPGLILAVIIWFAPSPTFTVVGLCVAALGRILGDIALRYTILKVGTYESLL